MPEEEKRKGAGDIPVDIDTSGPEVDVTVEEVKEKPEQETETDKTFEKEEVPKIKQGLLDKYEKEPVKEVTKEATKLPQPTGWRLLVLPFRMKEKTDGGLLLGTETIDRQQVASQCGNVLAMGPDCYNDPKRFSDGPWF